VSIVWDELFGEGSEIWIGAQSRQTDCTHENINTCRKQNWSFNSFSWSL